jgi:hypothetical protein
MPSPYTLALAAAVAAATLAACGPASQAPAVPPPDTVATPGPAAMPDAATADSQDVTRLASLQTSGYAEPAELVLRDAAAATAAWNRAHGGEAGTPFPDTDFTRRMVVLLALGERSTGGHAVRFDGMTTGGGGATVRYTATAPGPSCMTTQMMTQPVEIVSVPRVEGAVRFERRDVVEEC